MMGFSRFTPILPARRCRQRLGLPGGGGIPPQRRIIPRSTNRTGDDHLSCVGHQRLAPGVASQCSHESSRRTLSMLPIQRRLTSSSRFTSIMAQAAQRSIKTSSSPSSNSRSLVHTSITTYPHQHLPRHKTLVYTSLTSFKASHFNNPNTMVSGSVNRTSLHPGGVQ